MQTVKQPLTNAQLEILKAFSHNLDEKDLKDLRKALADFFLPKKLLTRRTWPGMKKVGQIRMLIGC